MADPYDSRFLDDPKFQSLLVVCLESLQRGETIDRDALGKDFPKFSEEIGQFLNDRELLEQVASDLEDVPPSHVAISAYANTMDSASSPKDFRLGKTVRYIGEYEVLDEIARGGMGVVFKARQQKLGRTVALKMILSGRLADSGDIERFYREARAAGRLTHSNIVPVHEVGEHDGRHYFTMDFVDGSSLAEIIRDETLSPQRAAELVRSIAQAIEYAHQQGTVHRDLKPANVLIDSSGRPKVTDFGLAKMLGSDDDETRAELTASGQVLGTPSYMSPEQATGKQELVGPASDIYSLGAILYACLTGRAPFVADSPVDTLLQVMNKEPVSPRELNPSVPKDLETICLKCLTKEPQKRYGTAEELADDVGRFLEGHPVMARPIGRIAKTMRWCRRNPVVASLLTLVFVSMLVGTAVSAFYASVANRHAEAEETQRQLAEQSRDEAEQARDEAQRERDAADRARELAEERGEDLRRQLYIAQMPRALEEWKAGNTVGVQQLLAKNIPEGDEDDLRGFEWYWLDNLTKSSRLTIETGSRILDSDISADGDFIVTLSTDHFAVHRLDNGEKISELQTSYAERGGVQFDSNGRFVAAGHDMVQLWDVEQQSLVWEGTRVEHTVWVGITPDDRYVLSAHVTEGSRKSGWISVRDRRTGVLIREIQCPDQIYTAAISPSGDQIAATCKGNQIRIWDLHSGVKLREWPVEGALFGLSYSTDGGWLTVATAGGRITRHDAVEGKRVEVWRKPSNSFRCLATDSTGGILAAAGNRQIAYLFDIENLTSIREFRGHAADIETIQFRPGVQELVTCDRGGKIQVWDTRVDQGVVQFDGAYMHIADAAFSPETNWFARCEGIPYQREQKGSVKLSRVPNGEEVRILDGHESGVFGVAIANGRVYSAGHDGKLITWGLETFEPVRTRSFDLPLTALAVSESGERLVVGSTNGTVKILSGQQDESEATFHLEPAAWNIEDVAMSPDGRFAAARTRGEIGVWDSSQGQIVLKISKVRKGPLAFSHSGKQLAITMDGTVRIYDTSTWEAIEEFEAHSQPTLGIAFHHSDRRLATRSKNGLVKLWETETWQNVMKIPLPFNSGGDGVNPIFSPNGNYLFVGREGSEEFLLSARTIPHEQTPEPKFFLSRAESFAKRQLWPEALHQYERVIELKPGKKWTYTFAAEAAAMLEPTDQTRQRIIDSVKRASEFEDQDLYLASRLIHAGQLRPNCDPDPDESLRIVKKYWIEGDGPSRGLSLLHTLFRQRRDEEIIEFRKHQQRGKSWWPNQMLHAGALYRTGRVHEAGNLLIDAANGYASDMPPLGRGRHVGEAHAQSVIALQLLWREVSQVALLAMNEAIESAPDDAVLLYDRGLLHRYWHRWPEAFQDLNRARELDPESLEILDATLVSAILAGEFEVASDLAGPFLAQIDTPEHREEIWSAARTVSLIPEATCFDESLLEKVQASAAANPSQPWKQIAVVCLLHRLERQDEAMAELDRINKAFPDFTSANVPKAGLSFRRGIMLHELGDEDASIQALKIGEALGRQSAQPPGVFPCRDRHTFTDYRVLHQELKTLLKEDGEVKVPKLEQQE